jgi:hypothetical protein
MVPLEETYLWRWLAGRVPVGTSRIRGSVRHPVHRAKSKFERPLHIEVYPQYSIYDGLDFLIINRGAARLLVAAAGCKPCKTTRGMYTTPSPATVTALMTKLAEPGLKDVAIVLRIPAFSAARPL